MSEEIETLRARIVTIILNEGCWETDSANAEHAASMIVAILEDQQRAMNAAIDDLRDTVVDLVFQFGYQTTHEHQPALWTGGLSALEGAFALLGWDDPHPCPEFACQMPECTEWATTGTPTSDGYKRLCSDHFWLVQDDEQRATT